METTKLQDVKKIFNSLKNEASIWQSTWKTLRDWAAPTRGSFEGEDLNNSDLINGKKIINNSVQMFLNNFASGMSSGMTSQARKWFKIAVNDKELIENQRVKVFLEEKEDKIYSIFATSNIYNALYSLYTEIGAFATACAFIEKDFEDVIRLKTFTIGEYFLAVNKKGLPNTFAREFTLTVSQIVDEFGEDNCSASVKTLFYNKQFDKPVKVVHIILPNSKIDYTKSQTNKNMPYSSFYYEVGNNEDKFLEESGFKIFPIIAPRWDTTTTTSVYGKNCPAWISLSDNRQIQHMEKSKLYNLDLLNDPPKVMDASIDNYDFRPGGETRYNSTNPNSIGVRNLDVNPIGLQELGNEMQIVIQRIAKAFFVDLFLMLSSQPDNQQTATEVRAKIEERMLMLAPALMRLNDEALSPLIEYTFATIMEDDDIENIPPELVGADYKIDYISTIAQAQKMVGTQAIEQGLSLVGNISAVKPDILDKVNFDEAVMEYFDKLNISPKVIRGDDEVADIRQSRQQAQQQVQQQEQAMNMVQGAKTLSDTEMKPNSALTALIGGSNG
jgi:hypothetical protein